jgi:hypothetical protein
MDYGLYDEAGVIAVVLALTQLVKLYVPSKFIPLVAVVLGVVGGIVTGGVTLEAGVKGLVLGLSAAGLYDQKAIVK